MSADSGCYDGLSRLSSNITDLSAPTTDDDDESVVRSEDGGHEMEYQPEDAQQYAPEITLNLDDLNKFATKTNQLECFYDEENKRFQKILQQSAVELKKLIKKCGQESVSEARPYYDALNRRKDLQIKCLLATREYEKCDDLCTEAKNAIRMTEMIFKKELEDRQSSNHKENFDQYWQEKLNLANQKFNEAKLKKEIHEKEHMEFMFKFRDLEDYISSLSKKHKFSIKRTKTYFDTAQSYDQCLKSIRNRIRNLEEEIQSSKNSYSKALKNLENISEEIHEKRAQEMTKFEREPGVGAEETNSVETISFASEFDSKCSIQTYSVYDEE